MTSQLAFSLLLVSFIGVNTLFWGTVAAGRVAARGVSERKRQQQVGRHRLSVRRRFRNEDVAVLMAAHNEAAVLAESLRVASALLPPSQIHVISDGSSDATVAIAEEAGVNVLDLNPNRGKAGALAAGIEHFDLAQRFGVILLLDADTRLSPDYLKTGLPLFNEPDVVAVSGQVKCLMDPPPHTLSARLLLAYRSRLYVLTQLIKFGQAAKWANVMPIIPGFASMYRTDVLSEIEITKPGLVIEDINMSFEVHIKELGRIAFEGKAAIAFTQDPDNWHDYTRQIHRWMLGYWQTLRSQSRHIRFSKFWVTVALQISELIFNSIGLLLVVPILLFSVYSSTLARTYGNPVVMGYEVIGTLDVTHYILVAFFLEDLLVTVGAAIALRRPGLLLLAPVFPFMRFIDAYIALRAIPTALRTRSNGAWVSPIRRAMNGGDARLPTPSGK